MATVDCDMNTLLYKGSLAILLKSGCDDENPQGLSSLVGIIVAEE